MSVRPLESLSFRHSSADGNASSIRVLICSANLGNAQPDTSSINEWIPLNGQVHLAVPRPPRFPVIMDPRRAQNPPPPETPSTPQEVATPDPPISPSKTRRRPSNAINLSSDSPGFGFLPDQEAEMIPVPHQLRKESMTAADYNAWLNQQQKEQNQGQSASDGDYEAFLAKTQAAAETSSDDDDDYDAFLASQQQKQRPSLESSERHRFRLSERSPSARFDYDESNSETASFADLIGTRNSGSVSFEGMSNSPVKRKSAARSSMSSTGSSIRFEAFFDQVPPPPANGTPQQERQRHQRADQVDDSAECFDIIVIGMQEATFETSNSKKAEKRGSLSEDASLSGSEGDDVVADLVAEINEMTPDMDLDAAAAYYSPSKGKRAFVSAVVSDDELEINLNESPQKSKKKSTAGKVLGATVKAGIAGLKAGKAGYTASKKVGKVTVKTAKAVNTLATAKDHTSRPLHSAQQANAPVMDGGFPGWADTDVLHYRFEDQLPNYDRALSYQLGEMRLIVYCNPINVDLDVLAVKTKPTGKGGLANKGGIVAEVAVNDSTRLSFLTAHLEAHEGEEKYATRCTSFMDILTGTKSSFTPIKYDASVSSHYTFVMGDLNFRTRLPSVEPGSERHIKICHTMTATRDWKMINKYDELAGALRKKDCLAGFRTPYCNFDPTFKVARQDGYEYNVKRSPSYTDRILFKAGDQLEPAIRPILYEPIEKFTTSDHKPIRGAFNIRLNEKVKWKPAVSLKKTKRRGSRSDDEDEEYLGETVNRETMHVLVSSMSCIINPDSYDKIRKTKKAELPNSYLSFVSTPAEAVQADSSKKSTWKKLLTTSKSSKPAKNLSDGKMKKMLGASSSKLFGGFPTTTTISDTMKPNWKKESIHFSVCTHRITGDPIDFSGSFLHITLFDSRDQKPFGTYSLNLAKLITVTKNPSLITNNLGLIRSKSSTAGTPLRGGGGPGLRPTKSGGLVGQMRGPSPARQQSNGGTMSDPSPARRVREPSPARQRAIRDASPARERSTGSAAGGRGPPSGGRAAGRGAPVAMGGRNMPGRGQIAPHSPGGREGGTPSRPSVRGGGIIRQNSGRGANIVRGGPGNAPGRGGPQRGGGRLSSGGKRPVGVNSVQGQQGWSYSSQPSAAMVEAADSDNGYPTPVQRAAKSLNSSPAPTGPQLDRRGSLKYVNHGPSKSMRDIMIEDGDEPEAEVEHKLRNLKIISLKLDEGLMEGGLEVARIRCCMDIWWVTEEDPENATDAD